MSRIVGRFAALFGALLVAGAAVAAAPERHDFITVYQKSASLSRLPRS
ncbi:MAG: hypothetical protein NTZ79_12160 [Proteobacteria bacterium]|nr:hypothetical protein [Pseudomonadota bacterium]